MVTEGKYANIHVNTTVDVKTKFDRAAHVYLSITIQHA
jgi:hypothetical protein